MHRGGTISIFLINCRHSSPIIFPTFAMQKLARHACYQLVCLLGPRVWLKGAICLFLKLKMKIKKKNDSCAYHKRELLLHTPHLLHELLSLTSAKELTHVPRDSLLCRGFRTVLSDQVCIYSVSTSIYQMLIEKAIIITVFMKLNQSLQGFKYPQDY